MSKLTEHCKKKIGMVKFIGYQIVNTGGNTGGIQVFESHKNP